MDGPERKEKIVDVPMPGYREYPDRPANPKARLLITLHTYKDFRKRIVSHLTEFVASGDGCLSHAFTFGTDSSKPGMFEATPYRGEPGVRATQKAIDAAHAEALVGSGRARDLALARVDDLRTRFPDFFEPVAAAPLPVNGG